MSGEQPFAVQVVRDDGRVIVRGRGALGPADVPRLTAAVEEALRDQPQLVEIDLRTLLLVSCEALRQLVQLARLADRLGVRLEVRLGREGLVLESGRERRGLRMRLEDGER